METDVRLLRPGLRSSRKNGVTPNRPEPRGRRDWRGPVDAEGLSRILNVSRDLP